MSASVRRKTFSSHPKPLVSVLTPTIRGRERFLAENRASVASQTLKNHEHLTLLDDELVGCAGTMNALASQARGDFIFILADDDLMLPRCLEIHVKGASADITYAPPLVWGEDHAQFWASPPGIPATALIAREFWEKMGGYDVSLWQTEDNDLWKRAEARGATFKRLSDEPTWVYRLGHNNKSRNGGRVC